MHSKVWKGLTNGHANSNQQVWQIYRYLGFQTIGLSNYQSIDPLNDTLKSYIPVYEHGYGLTKNHHLCIGADKVNWLDYILWQSLSNRQFVIDHLKPQVELLAVNHPAFSRGVKPADFSKLTGYDLMEVLNGFRISLPHWDSALSAGRPAFLIAGDDAHDVSNPREVGRKFTVYNAPANHREDVINALRSGKSYGVYMLIPNIESFESKKSRLSSLPVIEKLGCSNDSILLKISQAASVIRFIGQDGAKKDSICNSSVAFYRIKTNDTYIRIEIAFLGKEKGQGMIFYLNPIIRTQDNKLPVMPEATINWLTTWTVRVLSMFILLFLGDTYRINRKRNKPLSP